MGSLFAVDANGKPTDDLTYDFVPVKGNADQVIVTVTLDNDYLTAPDRAYPVVIDPTITISSSETADTCVCSNFPSTNYYLGTSLRTGYEPDYGIRRSYLRFNIPDSIAPGSITNATLDLEKVSGVAPTVVAKRVTGSWTSSTLNWSNKPGETSTGQSSQSVVFREGSAWYTMNVTSIVNSWVNGYSSNYGFVLIDNTENNANHWTTFYSSDANSPHKPELIISYNDGGSSGGGGNNGGTTESYIFYVNHYLDLGYRVRFPSGATDLVRSHQDVVSGLLDDLFGINVVATYTSFQSYMDDCKHLSFNSVHQSNLYLPCTHSPAHHTSGAVVEDFVGIYGNGTNTTSRAIWTGHILQDNARSTSWAASYTVLITPYAYVDASNNYATESGYEVNEESRFDLMHELSHQLGLVDHYCGKDSGQDTCNNDSCWKCHGWPNPICIMDERKNVEIVSSDALYCSTCINNVNSHLIDHH